MSGEFLKVQSSNKDSEMEEEKSGLMVGKVINNCDKTQTRRVKVRLATRGGMEIWARVAAPDTGMYFVPQENDEVLVAFHQGDGNEAYIMGQLWNQTKLPSEKDPVIKSVIRTPLGHEISFDIREQSITITTNSGQHVTLKQESIEVGVDDKNSVVIKLDATGSLNIEAKTSISLKAPTITLDATNLKLGSASSAQIEIG